jgi:hypothetical protein
MRLSDARRLTGRNLQSANFGALVEVLFEPGDDPAGLIARWGEALMEIEK